MTEADAISSRAQDLARAFDAEFAVAADTRVTPTVDVIEIGLGTDRYALRLDQIGGLQRDPEIVPLPSRLVELTGIIASGSTIVPVYDLGLVLATAASAGRWIALSGDKSIALAFGDYRGQHRVEFVPSEPTDAAHADRQVIRVGNARCTLLSVPALIETIRHRAPNRRTSGG